MARLVLFHSALGLRPAVLRFADRLHDLGHAVDTPDLYAGARFDTYQQGVAHRDAIGIPTLMERALAAVADLPTDVVYGGMSMGTAPAQLLAATRPGAAGALLLHGAAPLELFGLDRWPASVPVQLHTCDQDPWIDHEGLDAFAAAVPASLLEHATYPGSAHLFTDEDTDDHDPQAAEQVFVAAARFLEHVDVAPGVRS